MHRRLRRLVKVVVEARLQARVVVTVERSPARLARRCALLPPRRDGRQRNTRSQPDHTRELRVTALLVSWMGEPTSYATTSTAPQPDLSAGAQTGGNSQICNRTSRRVARGAFFAMWPRLHARTVTYSKCSKLRTKGARARAMAHARIKNTSQRVSSYDGGHCANSKTHKRQHTVGSWSRIHGSMCLSCRGINAIMVAP